MHPLPAGVHSDDSQLAPLLAKDNDTEASQGNTGGYSSDHPMTSPAPGQYQKLPSSLLAHPTSSLPGSSPIQIQRALSERSCMVLIFMHNIY